MNEELKVSDTIKMIEYEFNAQKALERIRYYRKQRDELLQELACSKAKLFEAAELLTHCEQQLGGVTYKYKALRDDTYQLRQELKQAKGYGQGRE